MRIGTTLFFLALLAVGYACSAGDRISTGYLAKADGVKIYSDSTGEKTDAVPEEVREKGWKVVTAEEIGR